IAPVNTSITYTATLTGGAAPQSLEFNNGISFTGLSAGDYQLCIRGTNGSMDYQENCFQLVVTQPEVLDMQALVQDGILDLTLNGAQHYTVELNGLVTQTSAPRLRLALKEGINTLRVTSELPCQGSLEKNLFHWSRPLLTPNPVIHSAQIHLNGHRGSVVLEIFLANGRLVQTHTLQAHGNDIELDLSTLPRGIYFLRVEKNGQKDTFKFIKK